MSQVNGKYIDKTSVCLTSIVSWLLPRISSGDVSIIRIVNGDHNQTPLFFFFFTQQKPTHVMGKRPQTSVSGEEINFLILQSPYYECMAAHHSWCVPRKVLIHIGATGAVEIPCWDCENCDWAHCVFLCKLLMLKSQILGSTFATDEKSLKKIGNLNIYFKTVWQLRLFGRIVVVQSDSDRGYH